VTDIYLGMQPDQLSLAISHG